MHVHGERTVYRRISKIWGFKVVDGCKTVHASQIVKILRLKPEKLNQCYEQNLNHSSDKYF